MFPCQLGAPYVSWWPISCVAYVSQRRCQQRGHPHAKTTCELLEVCCYFGGCSSSWPYQILLFLCISTELTNHFHQAQRIVRQRLSLLGVFNGLTVIYKPCYFCTGKSPKLPNIVGLAWLRSNRLDSTMTDSRRNEDSQVQLYAAVKALWSLKAACGAAHCFTAHGHFETFLARLWTWRWRGCPSYMGCQSYTFMPSHRISGVPVS